MFLKHIYLSLRWLTEWVRSVGNNIEIKKNQLNAHLPFKVCVIHLSVLLHLESKVLSENLLPYQPFTMKTVMLN